MQEDPAEKAAKEAAKARDKLIKTVIKEGGKKGVEIEGASDMGGLEFFCTTIEVRPAHPALMLHLACLLLPHFAKHDSPLLPLPLPDSLRRAMSSFSRSR